MLYERDKGHDNESRRKTYRLCQSTSFCLHDGIFFFLYVVMILVGLMIYLYGVGYREISIDFVVMGDWGGLGNANQTRLAGHMGRWCGNHSCEFILTTGDNFYPSGTSSIIDRHWKQSYEDVYVHPSIAKIPFYAILGNHDYKGWVESQIEYGKKLGTRWIMPSHFYNFTRTNKNLMNSVGAQFIMMDTTSLIDRYRRDARFNQTSLSKQNSTIQLEWIRRTLTLNDNRTHPWRFLVGHHCIYGDREKPASVPGIKDLIRKVHPIMNHFQVPIYFSGHDHNIQVFLDRNTTVGYHLLSGAGGGTKIKPSPRHPYHSYMLIESAFLYVRIFQDRMEIAVIGPHGTSVKEISIPLRNS